MTVATRPEPRARRRRTAGSYRALEWLLVRAPLLPAETYHRLDRETDRAAQDPRVLTALAVGASDLLGALERERDEGTADARLRRKLQRYLIRMSTRPTPYGLFAGMALAQPGPVTNLALGATEPHTRTRPDMAWLMSFVAGLEQNPEIRRQLRFRANTAARLAAGRVFLSERAVTGEMGHGGEAVSIRATAAAQRALALAREPCRWERLVETLLATPGATGDKVEQLLTDLWRQTLLLSELRPPLTCESPAGYVVKRLREVPAATDACSALEGLLDELQAWDGLSLEAKAAGYARVVDEAREAHSGADGPALQVDAELPLAGRQINMEVAEEAARAAELLLRLHPIGTASKLTGYCMSFEGRYGSQREVPLLELLDPDAGLGPPSRSDWSADADAERAARRDALLWELAVEALRDRRPEVELDDAMIEALQVATPESGALPVSLELSAFVLADAPESIDAGEFRLLVGPNLGAQAAGRNLGRFADLLGPAAIRALASTARVDERHRPGEVAVELVYLPARARSANVAVRPAIRSHELVLGTSPGVPDAGVVPLDELVVGIRGGRLYARWPRGDCELRVRAGHMLNSAGAPAAIRFLEDLGRDGTMELTPFDWGTASRLPYLPRVGAGRTILRPARWRIDAMARDRELPSDTPEEFAAALPGWRVAWSVPRRVYLSVGDNRLLLDLDEPEQAEQIREELRRVEQAGPVVLEEPLPGAESAWLPGPGGRYVSELVIPLVLGEPANGDARLEPAAAAGGPIRAAAPAARLRPPGSEWLFLKLYCPKAVEEDLIAGPLRSFGEFVTAAGLAAEWFFLRYSDPDPHLRLRLRGEPETLMTRLMPELCTWATELLEDERCSRFAFDTYVREIERYGGEEATAVAESAFAADSRAAADLLHLTGAEATSVDRTALAVLSIDDLLAGLGLSEAERLVWCREAVTARHESGDEFRTRSGDLRLLLGPAPGELVGEAPWNVLAARRAALAPLAEQLEELSAAGRLHRSRRELCHSHVHMHCNRLLGSGPPFESRVLGLLLRTRESLDRAPLTS